MSKLTSNEAVHFFLTMETASTSLPENSIIDNQDNTKFVSNNTDTDFLEVLVKGEPEGYLDPTNSPRLLTEVKLETVKHEESENSAGPDQLLNCVQCCYKSRTQLAMKMHVSRRHGVKCTNCDFTAKSKVAMRKHVTTKHPLKNRKFIFCEQCSFKVKLAKQLHLHILYEHTTFAIKVDCSYCSYKAKNVWDIGSHLLTVHNISREFKCNICNRSFEIAHDLIMHVQLTHVSKSNVTAKSVSKPNVTVKSNTRVTNQKNYIIYWGIDAETQERSKWFCCDYCCYKSKLRDDLDKHVTQVHSLTLDAKWFVCDRCGFMMESEGELEKHVLTTHT